MDRAGHLYAVALAIVGACGSPEPRVPGLRIDITKMDDRRELLVHYEDPALREMGAQPIVRARCLVGGLVKEDRTSAFPPMVEVAPGSHIITQLGQFDTRLFTGFDDAAYPSEPRMLRATPSVCELSIVAHLEKSDLLVEACARLDHPPAPGLCPPGSFPRATSP